MTGVQTCALPIYQAWRKCQCTKGKWLDSFNDRSTKGSSKSYKALIDGGADVNLKNNDGATAQMIAANKGYFSLEKMLAESNSITEEDFKKICHNGNAAAVLELLKKKNIPSDFMFENGETLLRTAIRVASTSETIQALLDFGFDVNAHIDNGGTALTAEIGRAHV